MWMDLSLALVTDTTIVPLEGATNFNFGNSATLQELEGNFYVFFVYDSRSTWCKSDLNVWMTGNQVQRLKDCCIQYYGKPNGNNGVD